MRRIVIASDRLRSDKLRTERARERHCIKESKRKNESYGGGIEKLWTERAKSKQSKINKEKKQEKKNSEKIVSREETK